MSRKRILITGVSSGIGRGLADYALAKGWIVYGLSRRTVDIDHADFHFLACDLNDFRAIGARFEELGLEKSTLDLVVLNAGVLGELTDMAQQDMQAMQSVMNINLWSNKVVIDELLKRTHCKQVVAISSGAAVNGSRGWGGYSLSKAALNMLIKLYAAEQPDIHFTALAPGLVDTFMQETISGLPSTEALKGLDRIKAARGTDAMPTPDVFANRFFQILDALKKNESGGFADIRTM